MKHFAGITAALLCLSLLACTDSTTAKVTDGWVRLAPPTAKVNAGYLTIENPSDADLKLISGSAEGYESVELHMMRMNGGNMIMRQVESFTVPAGGELKLSPGGDHLMLIAPNGQRAEGDTVQMILQLSSEDGSVTDLAYTFIVRRN